jgi:predicted ATPase
LRLADHALVDAESAAHAPTMNHAVAFAALLGLVWRHPEAVATHSRVLADIVSRYDLPAWWAGTAVFLQGWAKWSDGAEESRFAEMRRGLAVSREQGALVWQSPAEAALAIAEASAGEVDGGLRHLDDALAELERTEERWYEAEMHRILAEILLKRDPTSTAAAEQSLQAAIAIAQSQKARSFELRAALSLAKLYRVANRAADAYAILAPAVEGFPPTQQFPELTEAQALLSALSERDALSRELASREDASERFSAYHSLWGRHLSRGEPAPMREMAELLLREAAARPDCPETLIADHISGCTCLQFGDFAGAHQHFQKTIELYDPTRHGDLANRFGQDPRVAAEILDALTLWVLGRVDDSLRLSDRALADAEPAGHAPTMGHALAYAAFLGLFRRSPEAVATDSQALADVVSRYDFPGYWAGIAIFLQGWAMSRLAEMRRGLAIYREQGRIWLLPEAVLAEAEASAGETVAGLRRLDGALTDLQRTEERLYEAEIHRIRSEILLKRDPADTAAAEQSLQTAISVAQSQKARSFETRAALSLARLYHAADRGADAHAVLAPAVEGFPPTQQFPELTEGQALISVLSR